MDATLKAPTTLSRRQGHMQTSAGLAPATFPSPHLSLCHGDGSSGVKRCPNDNSIEMVTHDGEMQVGEIICQW